AVARIRAAGLAERVVGARRVEDVVDDLKQHPQLGGEVAKVGCRRGPHTSYQQYALYRRADQPAGLQLVGAPDGVGGVSVAVGDARDVEVLAADHPVDPRRGGELADGGEDVRGLAGLLREDKAKRLRVEAVAGEDGCVLAERDVVGGA